MNWIKKLFFKAFSQHHPPVKVVENSEEFLEKKHWNFREKKMVDKNHKVVLVIGPLCRRCPYPHHLHLYLYYQLVNTIYEFNRLIANKETIVLKSFDFERIYGTSQRVLAFSISNGLALYEIVNDPS
jgi:hypothetical protein